MFTSSSPEHEVQAERLSTSNNKVKKTEPEYETDTGYAWVILVACRSEEHTSELQSLTNLVCRLLLEKKNQISIRIPSLQSLLFNDQSLDILMSSLVRS